MLCTDSLCKKEICRLCLIKSHKSHNVVDLEEKQKKNYRRLMKNIEKVSEMLTEEMRTNRACHEGLKNEYEKSLKMIKLRKEELVRKISEHMDKLETEIFEHRRDQDTEIQNEKETIETNTEMLQGIQDDVNEMPTLEDIEIKSELVENLCKEAQKRSRPMYKPLYTFIEFCEDDDKPRTNHPIADPLEQLCGKTRKKVVGRSALCCIS